MTRREDMEAYVERTEKVLLNSLQYVLEKCPEILPESIKTSAVEDMKILIESIFALPIEDAGLQDEIAGIKKEAWNENRTHPL